MYIIKYKVQINGYKNKDGSITDTTFYIDAKEYDSPYWSVENDFELLHWESKTVSELDGNEIILTTNLTNDILEKLYETARHEIINRGDRFFRTRLTVEL